MTHKSAGGRVAAYGCFVRSSIDVSYPIAFARPISSATFDSAGVAERARIQRYLPEGSPTIDRL
jgi:hypothetical protein